MLVLATVSLGVPLALSLSARVNAEVRSQAEGQADLVAATAGDLLTPVRARQLVALASTASRSVRGRVIVVDRLGRVVADSARAVPFNSSYARRPEISTALRGRQVQTQRHSVTLGQDILATAVPIIRNGATIGAVRVTQSVTAVRNAVRRTILGLGLIGLVVLILGLSAGALIARQVAQPLRRLEQVARRIAGGDLSARAVVEGSAEQRSLGRSFNEMTRRIDRLLRSQQEFVADASHQLRNPLTGLRLRLGEARAAGVSPRVAQELDAGTAEVDRLGHIVEELLVLSRVGERELPGEALGLDDLAGQAVKRWAGAAAERNIALQVVGRGAGARLWCARSDAERALDALVENALQYSPAGSTVTVASTLPASIEVSDDGPGIAADETELVFERFHRGSAGRAGPAGTGLGLSIARELARAWDGDVTLRNGPEGGTTATLSFRGCA